MHHIHTLVNLLFCKFHNKDGILCHKSHKHHQTDLEIDVVFKSAQPYAGIGTHTCNRERQNHGQRHRPALVKSRQEKEHEQQRQSEHKAGLARLMFLLVRQSRPLHCDILWQMLTHNLLESGHCLTGAVALSRFS